MNTITWMTEDMITVTLEHWGRAEYKTEDCEVVDCTNNDDERFLMVIHRPTGRTSDEAGDAGRWHLDGTAFGV